VLDFGALQIEIRPGYCSKGCLGQAVQVRVIVGREGSRYEHVLCLKMLKLSSSALQMTLQSCVFFTARPNI
jgi:hypothetical protein